MAPVDYTNPHYIRFMKENNEKVAILRARWNELHGPKLLRAATFYGEEKGYTEADVARKAVEGFLPALSRDHVNAGCNRRCRPKEPFVYTTKDLVKEHSIQSLGLGDPKSDIRLGKPDNDPTFDPIMRPVPSEQKEILREKGSQAYLKERSRIKLENKYYFDECSSWKLGWRLQDSSLGRSGPSYPRQRMLTEGRMSRTGAQPDPQHYTPSTAIQQREQCVK
ncbi:hypothetical protein NE865_09495 [Phthorimaea operculella]|nr:hypothetical protein NE865_09495 [Phthorimaea operculella]